MICLPFILMMEDVESSVPVERIAVQPDSEAMVIMSTNFCRRARINRIIAVFDEDNTGTIHARKLFQILTEMGDPLDTKEAEEILLKWVYHLTLN